MNMRLCVVLLCLALVALVRAGNRKVRKVKRQQDDDSTSTTPAEEDKEDSNETSTITPGPRNETCPRSATTIRVQEKKEIEHHDEDADTLEDTRRSHMNAEKQDEECQICVCSANGVDEYCSVRPARTVNECIRMAMITEEWKSNIPYSHDRILSLAIRKNYDYIWHYDEIPYSPQAKCKRAVSYYTNNPDANRTTIELPSDVESLLDYANDTLCLYCVCSTGGDMVHCLPRNLWYCDYFRYIRQDDASREMYKELFQQDRPAYFRQLSYRLRRTMDNGMYDLLQTGGDTLCCDHPDGHRRTLHSNVLNRIRQMKRKITKENLMNGHPNGDYVDFVVNNDK